MSLYIEASRIISRPRYGGLRGAIYSDSSLKSRPEQLYALIIETLKYQEILNEVIDKSGLLGVERMVTAPLPPESSFPLLFVIFLQHVRMSSG